MDLGRFTRSEVVEALNATGIVTITSQNIAHWLEGGCPQADDKTLDIVQVCAWLAKQRTRAVKNDLVPTEVCTKCGASIAPQRKAFIWQGNIVCFKCKVALNKEKRDREREQEILEGRQRWAEDSKWISESQRSYFIAMGVNVPEKATKIDASRAFDALEHLRHFIYSVWLDVSCRHAFQCGLHQADIKVWSAQYAFDEPAVADAIIKRVSEGGHSRKFLNDIDDYCKKATNAAFSKLCRDLPTLSQANRSGRRCPGGSACPGCEEDDDDGEE